MKLSKQEFFDEATKRIIKQGFACTSDGSCRYARDEDDAGCVFGLMLSREARDALCNEDLGVRGALGLLAEKDIDPGIGEVDDEECIFLEGLQNVHDAEAYNGDVEIWRKSFMDKAREFAKNSDLNLRLFDSLAWPN